jgi:uncharacterized membrane protein
VRQALLVKKIKDKVRGYFIAGLLTVVPLSITIYVIAILLKNADRVFNLLPDRFNPKAYLPFPLPGLGILLVVVLIFATGVLVKNYIGGKIVDFGERIVCQIPLVRPIYTAVKQLLVAIFSTPAGSFKRVVLIEYPRKGIYALGFVTGVAWGEVQEMTNVKVINVFLPTTPNPTSGFYLLVPEQDTIPLEMNVEDAFKLLISGGLVAPPARPGQEQAKAKAANTQNRLISEIEQIRLCSGSEVPSKDKKSQFEGS